MGDRFSFRQAGNSLEPQDEPQRATALRFERDGLHCHA
jgi:hypothetical protein